jgi:hypothetical protein
MQTAPSEDDTGRVLLDPCTALQGRGIKHFCILSHYQLSFLRALLPSLICLLLAMRNTIFIFSLGTFSNPFIIKSSSSGFSSIILKTQGGYSLSALYSGSGPSAAAFQIIANYALLPFLLGKNSPFDKLTGICVFKSYFSSKAGVAGPDGPFPLPFACCSADEGANAPRIAEDVLIQLQQQRGRSMPYSRRRLRSGVDAPNGCGKFEI